MEVESDWNDFDGPPPPDNFPTGWDNEWQPSFDNAAIAARPEEPASSLAVGIGGGSEKTGSIESPKTEAQTVAPVSPPVGGTEGGPVDEVPPPALRVPSLYPAVTRPEDREHPPQQITVILRPSPDKEVDKRRIKTIYGTLISFHGRDRFTFQIFENGKGHLIDFPNDTTRICPEMLARLKKLIGEESWRIEPITLQ
jgi:hypothetical protein